MVDHSLPQPVEATLLVPLAVHHREPHHGAGDLGRSEHGPLDEDLVVLAEPSWSLADRRRSVVPIGEELFTQRRVLVERRRHWWARLRPMSPPIRAIDVHAAYGDDPVRDAAHRFDHPTGIALGHR